MVECPECTHAVSLDTEACPGCGYPVAEDPLGALKGVQTEDQKPGVTAHDSDVAEIVARLEASADDDEPSLRVRASSPAELIEKIDTYMEEAGLEPELTPSAGTTRTVQPGETPRLVSMVRRMCSLEELEALLSDSDVDVNAADGGGDQYTALHYAAWNGRLDQVQALVAAGADVRATGTDGREPLALAAAGGIVEVARVLLKAGASVNHRIDDDDSALAPSGGDTCLRLAVGNQLWDMVDLLLDHGADPACLLEPCAGGDPDYPVSPGDDFFTAAEAVARDIPDLWELYDPARMEEMKRLASGGQTDTESPTDSLDYSAHEGDLDLSDLTSAKGLKLPEVLNGSLDLSGLTSADGLVLPRAMKGHLTLTGVETAPGLRLPEPTKPGARLGMSLEGLKDATGVQFPQAAGDLYLTGLETVSGLDLPTNVYGMLKLPLALEAQFEVDPEWDVVWGDVEKEKRVWELVDDPPHAPKLPDEWIREVAANSSVLSSLGADGTAHLEKQLDARKDAATIGNWAIPREVCEAIIERIRRTKEIPAFVPYKVQNTLAPAHKWSNVLWYMPAAILRAGLVSPICLELQGLSMLPESSWRAQFEFFIDFEHVVGVPDVQRSEWSPRAESLPNPRWRALEFDAPTDPQAALMAIFEFQPSEEAGFHLEIMQVIIEAVWPMIEASRGSGTIALPFDGVKTVRLQELDELYQWAFLGWT